MIIITDAHVNPDTGNDRDFFQMLNVLESCQHDLLFLGDIFDLWIALHRYEEDVHRKFLSWCQNQKKHRTIGFIEGNHEFFLAEERKAFFSWCSSASYWKDDWGNLYCHGDQINRQDTSYLWFRRIVRNKVTKTILRFLPQGPRLVKLIKHSLKKTNTKFQMYFPREEIENFAETKFIDNTQSILVGHFHRGHVFRNSETQKVHLLPDWFSTNQITLYHQASRHVTFHTWQHLSRV